MQDEEGVGVEQGDVGEVQEEDDDEAVIIVESEDEVRAQYYCIIITIIYCKSSYIRNVLIFAIFRESVAAQIYKSAKS